MRAYGSVAPRSTEDILAAREAFERGVAEDVDAEG
jgi:hypothetical protein